MGTTEPALLDVGERSRRDVRRRLRVWTIVGQQRYVEVDPVLVGRPRMVDVLLVLSKICRAIAVALKAELCDAAEIDSIIRSG